MKTSTESESQAPKRLMLFVVWIDTNLGDADAGTDWEMNSAHICPAKPLQDALDEAAYLRSHGYPTAIMPEGVSPRPDGLFSNPATDS